MFVYVWQTTEAHLLASTQAGTVSSEDILNACIPLVYSKSTSLLERGVFKLAELLREKTNLEREIGLCALYHLALGHYKLGDERVALGLVQSLLAAKSFHTSAVALKQICIDKMISKHKSSGLFSRLLRKKDESVAPIYSAANLTFLTEEEERTKQSQAEKDRDLIASLAPPSPPDSPFDDVDEIATSPHSTGSPSSPPIGGANNDFDSPFDFDASSASLESSNNLSPTLLSPSSSQHSIPVVAASSIPDHIAGGGHRAQSTGAMSAPGSIALNFSSLAGAGSGARGSAWIRSTPKDGQPVGERRPSSTSFAGSIPLNSSTPEPPVEKKTRKLRPLRASQSQRSAPTLSFMPDGSVLVEAPENDDSSSDEEDWDDDGEEKALETEIGKLEISTFNFPAFSPSFTPGSGLYTDSNLTAHQVVEAEALHAQHGQQIELAKVEYQALLQAHQAAQYELLRIQQEEVTLLNAEQLSLLEEEKDAAGDADRLAQLSPRFRALTERQGPLLVKQQEDQALLVEQQGVEQKARQDAFRQILLEQQNEKAGLAARQESELVESERQALLLEHQTYESRKSIAAADFEGNLFANLASKRERLDSLRTERATKEVEREARRAAKARAEAEAEALRHEQQRIEAERLRLHLEEESRRALAQAAAETQRLAEEQQRRHEEAEALAEQSRQAEQQRQALEQERLIQQRQLEERQLEAQRAEAEAQAAQAAQEEAIQNAALLTPTSPAISALPPAPAPLSFEQAPTSMPAKIHIGSPPVMRAPSGGPASFKSPVMGLRATPPGTAVPVTTSTTPPTIPSAANIPSSPPPSLVARTFETPVVAAAAVEGGDQDDPDVIDVFALSKRLAAAPNANNTSTATSGGFSKRPVSVGPVKTQHQVVHAHSTNEQGLARNNLQREPSVPTTTTTTAGAPGSLKHFPTSSLTRPGGPPPSAPPKVPPPTAPGSTRMPITKASSTNSPTVDYTSGTASPSGPPPPSSLPPSVPPPSGPPSSLPPSRPVPGRPPSMAPPAAPPSAAPPALPSSGPPPSSTLPSMPSGPPPSSLTASSGGGGRPQPPGGGSMPPSGARPQPPSQQVSANQAFAKPSGPPPSSGPPPMPSTASVGPPSQRMPVGGPPPMPSTAPPGSRSSPSPAPTSAAPYAPTSSPAPVSVSGGGGGGFYGPPPGFSGGSSSSASDAPTSYSSMSDKERSAATSTDTVSGVTKDKKGLPVSKTTHKGAHLLNTASKAKGPSRRPPSTMVRKPA